MDWNQGVLTGFAERARRLALFKPLFNLENKIKYQYDLTSLGLSILLFILEDMLRGRHGCTYEAISRFLHGLIESQYDYTMTDDEAAEFARFLVDALRNSGRPFEFRYPDFEHRGETTVKFHLIAYDDYDLQDRLVRLKLSEEGLQLLFQTRELHQELRISIMQLYLRQQIVKGVFEGALRSVDELRLEVQNLGDQLQAIRERIARDVLAVSQRQEHVHLFERIQDQLRREKRIFVELEGLVRQAHESYQTRHLNEKEERVLNQIAQLQQRLSRVISQHDRLFSDKLEVQQLVGRSLESVIVNAFSTKLNFEREVLEPAAGANIGLSGLKGIIDPVLPIRIQPRFNPWKAFERQALMRELEGEHPAEETWQLEQDALAREAEREQQERRERERRYEFFLRLLLEPLLQQPSIRLSKIFTDLARQDQGMYRTLVDTLDFYPFIVQLHQMDVIPLRRRWELGFQVVDDFPRVIARLCEAEPRLRSLEAFQVQAVPEIIRLENGCAISDFIIRRDGRGV